MNTPLFSILVANYNREPYLRQSIESLLTQTYPNIEVIVVDDGSTDGSMAIIEEFRRKDSRIKVYQHQTNLGCGAAMRKCVDLAAGEWMCLVGSDDVLTPDAIQTMAV